MSKVKVASATKKLQTAADLVKSWGRPAALVGVGGVGAIKLQQAEQDRRLGSQIRKQRRGY